MENRTPKDLSQEHCRIGFDHVVWGNTAEALKEFQTALEIWPDNPQAHCQIGQIHLSSRKPNLSEALKEFETVTRLAPDWGEGHLCCGNALDEMGRGSEAESFYKEAARLMPADARPHTSLAICLVKLGRFSDAITFFRRGIALKPHYGEISARMMLADALLQNGQTTEAISEWEIVSNMKAVWDYEEGEPERAKKLMTQFGRS